MNPDQIKILLILRAPAGGIRKHILAFIENLPSQKYFFYLVSNLNDSDSDFKAFLNTCPTNCQIRHLKIGNSPSPYDFVNLFHLFRSFKKDELDLIHGHGAKGGIYSRLLGLLFNKKVLYTPHGGSLHDMHGQVFSHIYSAIEWVLYFLTDKFVFESTYTETMYKQKVLLNSSKYVVNLNGVSQNGLPPCNGHKPTPFKIASFSALRKIKGIDIAIKAIALLKKEGLPVNFTIHGEGDDKIELSQLVRELELTDFVFFKGEVGNCRKLMTNFDAVIQPSFFESFGYTLIEAMAEGVLAIAADTGGMKEIIHHNENGYLFPTGDSVQLAKLIKMIINQPIDQLNEVRKKAYLSVEDNFNEAKMVSGLSQIYQGLSK